MKNKAKKMLQASVAIAILVACYLPQVTAKGTESIESLKLELGGPYAIAVGDFLRMNAKISGGVPPYHYDLDQSRVVETDSGRLVLSGGNGPRIQIMHNQDEWVTATLVIVDSVGNVAKDSAQIFVYLPTDNTVFIEKFVKVDGSTEWQKRIDVTPGTILNMKIVVTTIGSKSAKLTFGDEFSRMGLSYIEGSANVKPTYIFEGNSQFGPSIVWDIQELEPGTQSVFTYDMMVDTLPSETTLLIEDYAVAWLTPLSLSKGVGPIYAAAYDLNTINIV